MNDEAQLSINAPITHTEPKKKSRKYCYFFGVLLIVLIIAILGLMWFGKKSLETQQLLQRKNQQLAFALANINHQMNVQNAKLNNVQQQINQFQTQNEMRENWLLSKAEYLTQLAAFNLVFQNDVITARKILTEADHQLESLNTPKIWAVRKVLANDIANLNSITPVDIAGIVAKIAVLSQQIEQLPHFPNLTIRPEQLKPATRPPATSMNFETIVKAVGHSLKDLVIVQHDTPATPPLLPPDQYLYLITNIQFQLAMAQWAVIHQQQDLYQQSLNQAVRWLTRYYSPSDPAVKAIATDLQNLKNQVIKPQLPDLSNSIEAIQQALAQS
jgi:uroporphyrin-3 C-methyltransferase